MGRLKLRLPSQSVEQSLGYVYHIPLSCPSGEEKEDFWRICSTCACQDVLVKDMVMLTPTNHCISVKAVASGRSKVPFTNLEGVKGRD